MAVKIRFDHGQSISTPVLVLAKRNGNKLGVVPATGIHFTDNLNSMNTFDFSVSKINNNTEYHLWDEIRNFRLLWCKDWDAWFEITVEIDEDDEITKKISARAIGESELSAIKLYEIEINTEDDIARDDYVPCVLYDKDNEDASLLNRIMEKAPHYHVAHVDSTISRIQRTFSFNDTTIYSAFQEIGEEIGCLFVLSQSSSSDGTPDRGIYVYDLKNYCNNCKERGDFTKQCSECGSTDITIGYGEDTTVFISNENIAKEIIMTTDTDSVNTCFRLEAGDDLMTSTIISCNPNGSEFLWYIPDELKDDMSESLVNKLDSYNSLYDYYQKEYDITLDSSLSFSYNSLVEKYITYNEELEKVSSGTGFDKLVQNLYSAIDFELYLQSGLLPTANMSESNANYEASLLNSSSLSTLSVTNLSSVSAATVDLNILSLAKAIVNNNFQVKIKTSEFNKTSLKWVGVFTITNYSDENDTADTASITVTVTDNYERFIKQKIDVLLGKSKENFDVTSLFKKELTYSNGTFGGDFANELTKYALNALESFYENCQSCLDILVEEGVSDSESWIGITPNLYEEYYTKYYQKLQAIEAEINLRSSEIKIINDMYEHVHEMMSSIQENLDFHNYIGDSLWKEFCAFRRESTYTNSNYISDGLSTSELVSRAKEFISAAKKDLTKSATLQHSISMSLNNLLIIPGFEPILDHFAVGNWIRVRLDGKVYKLRLISYSIDFDNIDEITVEFSDVINCCDDITDLQSILSQTQAIATTYKAIERQSEKGNKAYNTVDSWFEDGLNATFTKIVNNALGQTMLMDSHGLLLRQYDEITRTYSDEQLKVINSTLAITDDNWKTTKTAIGKFIFKNPKTGDLETAYGVNGETVVGKLLIGENLALYNTSGSMTFDENGLTVTNSVNTFQVNPNASSIVKISKSGSNVFWLDSLGNLSLSGIINATGGYLGTRNPFVINENGLDGYYKISDYSLIKTKSSYKSIEYSGEYIHDFTISIEEPQSDNSDNNIELLLKSVVLTISYAYYETHKVNGVDMEFEFDDTITYSLIDSDTDVSSQVSISTVDDVDTYSYTYSWGSSNMRSYYGNIIKNISTVLPNDYDINNILILGGTISYEYSYQFNTTLEISSHIGSNYFKYNNLLIDNNGLRLEDNARIQNIDTDSIHIRGGLLISCDTFSVEANSIELNNNNSFFVMNTKGNGYVIPIVIRQCNGKIVINELKLLDSNGDTILPGNLRVCNIFSTQQYINFHSEVVFNGADTYLGYASIGTERRIRIASTMYSGTYQHDTFIYGGNGESPVSFGLYDGVNRIGVWNYNDQSHILNIDTTLNINTSGFEFKDLANQMGNPISTAINNNLSVARIYSIHDGLAVKGRWSDGHEWTEKTIVVSSSDERLKHNITISEVTSALDVINKIIMKSFDWNDGKHQKIGFIADELEQLDENFSIGGGYMEDGSMNVKVVNDFYLMGYIVKAIQELYDMIKNGDKE